MAKSKVFTTNVPAGTVSFNVVPLVDCAFLMILFFILTSQIADATNRSVVYLPTPVEGQGLEPPKSNTGRVTVNVVSAEINPDKNKAAEMYIDPAKAGDALRYEIFGDPINPKDQQTLVNRLTREKKAAVASGVKQEEFYVVIRADWRVKYEDILPIFEAAAEAKIPKMNISVLKAVAKDAKEPS